MISASPLSNQVVVVTGAGRGIGAAIAQHVASMGATVVACARTEKDLTRVVGEIEKQGGKAVAIPCDVSDMNSVQDLQTEVEKRYNRLDALVNNAGVGGFAGPLHEMTPQDWEKILNTNLRGVYYCIRAFAPMMIRGGGGHIVNVSSLAGKNPLKNGAAYAASKWGLNGLSYSAAEELRDHKVRVSVVGPGSVDTSEGWHHGKNSNKMLKPADVALVVGMLLTQAPQSFVSEVLIRPTLKP